MPKKTTVRPGISMTVPNDMVERGIRSVVAASLDIDSDRVVVIRITRKKGGGVEADVKILTGTDEDE